MGERTRVDKRVDLPVLFSTLLGLKRLKWARNRSAPLISIFYISQSYFGCLKLQCKVLYVICQPVWGGINQGAQSRWQLPMSGGETDPARHYQVLYGRSGAARDANAESCDVFLSIVHTLV